MFEVAIGRHPFDGELCEMLRIGGDRSSAGAVDYLRIALAIVDQLHNPSAVAVRFGPDDTEYLSLGSISLCIDKADLSISQHIRNTQTYEPHMVAFFQKILRPGMRTVDIGANMGFYSMVFAEAVGPDGRVYAFEPRSDNCRLLLLSAARNGFHNIRLHPLALSSPGQSYLTLTPAIGTNSSTNVAGDVANPATFIVPAAALDDVINEPIDLIKADIEGAEYKAFRGGERLITVHRPIVTSEFSLEMLRRVSGIDGWDLIKWLVGLDYRAFVIWRHETALKEITSLDAMKARWGRFVRIEDLAFVPKERADILSALGFE